MAPEAPDWEMVASVNPFSVRDNLLYTTSACENKIFHKLPLLRERQDKCDMKSLVNVCNNVLSISEGDHPMLDRPMLDRPMLDHPMLDHLTLDHPTLDHLNHHLAKTTSFVCSSHPCNSPYGVEVATGGTYCYPNPQYLVPKMGGWTAVAERRQEGVVVGELLREVWQHGHQQLQTLLSCNLADLMLHLILEVVDFAFEPCDGSHNLLNMVSRQGAR